MTPYRSYTNNSEKSKQIEDYYKKIVSGGTKQSEANKQEAASIACQTSTMKKLTDIRQDSFPVGDTDQIRSHIQRQTCVVYKVKTKENGVYKPNGSAFLIAPNLIMTNKHVIPTQEIAKKSKLFYKELVGNSEIKKMDSTFYSVSLLPDEKEGGYFFSGPLLDFTIVAIEVNQNVQKIMSHAFSLSRVGKLKVDKLAAIIHYPEGVDGDSGELDLVRDSIGTIQSVDNHYAHHDLKTQQGSSGSPIFNLKGKLIGLHRQGKGICSCSVNNRCCNACISMKSILAEMEKEGQTQKIKDFSSIKSSLLEKDIGSCQSNLPHVISSFIGRIKELEEIKEAFKISNKVAIAGIGGMGKSTLSFKYASELIGYRFIHFIKATAPEAIRAGLIELAIFLGLNKEKHKEPLAELKGYLQQMALPGLIIIDGLDEESFFQELTNHVPNGKKCQILISTRVGPKAKVNGFNVIPLTQFSNEEAIYYLTKMNKPVQKERLVAEMLAKEVGYHPLALSHIARYLEQEKISLCEYKEKFEGYDLKLPGKDDINIPTEEVSVFITWQVSLFAIGNKERGTLAINMIKFISILGEEDIPFDLLNTFAKTFYPHEDQVAITGAIKLLKDYTFFQERIGALDQKKYYQVHSLVQKVTAYQLSQEEKKRIIREAACSLHQEIKKLRSFPRIINWNKFNRLRSLYQVHTLNVHAIEYTQQMLTIEDRIQLFSHLGWLLGMHSDYEMEVSHSSMNGECQTYVNLGIKLGQTFFKGSESLVMAELYHLKGDRQSVRKGLEIREKILGKTSEYTVESYEKLSFILHIEGNANEALILAQHVLEIRKKRTEKVDYWILMSYSNVIDLLKRLGKNEEALAVVHKVLDTESEALECMDYLKEQVYKAMIVHLKELGKNEDSLIVIKKLLERRRGALGEGNELTLDGYELLIDFLKKLGRNEEALPLALKLLETSRKIFGEGNYKTSESYEKIICILKELGRKEEALNQAQKMLEIRRDTLGEENEWTSESYEKVICILKELGRKEEALNQAQKMLEIRRDTLGEENEWTSESYEKVICILKELGRKEEALTVAQSMLEIRRDTLGEENEWTSESYEKVICILKELGRTEEALTVAQSMLEIRRDTLGEENEWTSESYEKVICILKELGRKEEALAVAQSMLEIRRDTLGEENEWTLESCEKVIYILKELGRKEEALTIAQRMLEIRRDALGEGNRQTSESYKKVIGLLKELGRKEETLIVVEKRLERRRAALGERNKLTVDSYEQLIDFLKKLGRNEEALPLAQKLLEIKREVLDEGDYEISQSYEQVINLLKELGRNEEALTVVHKVLERVRETLGEADYWTLSRYRYGIAFFKELGRNEEAIDQAQKTLELSRKIFGEGNYHTFASYEQLIDLLKELGRNEEAFDVEEKMLKIRIERLEEGDKLILNKVPDIDLLKKQKKTEKRFKELLNLLNSERFN
ncbi:tetratricopeptide repeat protein [Rhabdochlamydiaceae symbiont of Dictyostelium giganteum]|uniref:tetratricopeptide repeat protein n=1 Tax=Rhabdochlamydiaceae symbiont of Dictyostelium giganteum TaxID=3342349 RepID=UPI0038506D60